MLGFTRRKLCLEAVGTCQGFQKEMIPRLWSSVAFNFGSDLCPHQSQTPFVDRYMEGFYEISMALRARSEEI
jgi:hypothetical protein